MISKITKYQFTLRRRIVYEIVIFILVHAASVLWESEDSEFSGTVRAPGKTEAGTAFNTTDGACVDIRKRRRRRRTKRVVAPGTGQLLQAQNSGESLWKAKSGLGDYYRKILNNRAS